MKAKWMIHDEKCEKIANPAEQGCGCLIRYKANEAIKTLESKLAEREAELAKLKASQEEDHNHVDFGKCREYLSERDRYRKALEKIANSSGYGEVYGQLFNDIAKAALNNPEGTK